MSLKPILFCCFYAASAAFHYSPTYPPLAVTALLSAPSYFSLLSSSPMPTSDVVSPDALSLYR